MEQADFVFGSPNAGAAESSSENMESTYRTSLREEAVFLTLTARNTAFLIVRP